MSATPFSLKTSGCVVSEIKIMTLPPETDPADLFLLPNGCELWERAVREAKPAMSWSIARLDNMHDLASVRGKIAAARSMLDSLIRCSPIERSTYVRELADKLDVREADLRATLNEQFSELKEVELKPEPQPRLVRLDHYGEAIAFPCPDCGSSRTHYALKTMRCWNCDEIRIVPTVPALNRQIAAGWERRIKEFETTINFNPDEPTSGIIDISRV